MNHFYFCRMTLFPSVFLGAFIAFVLRFRMFSLAYSMNIKTSMNHSMPCLNETLTVNLLLYTLRIRTLTEPVHPSLSVGPSNYDQNGCFSCHSPSLETLELNFERKWRKGNRSQDVTMFCSFWAGRSDLLRVPGWVLLM